MSALKNALNFPNFEDFVLSEAKKGIVVKYADIVFGKYFIYILTPRLRLYPCVIYSATISEGDYHRGVKPLVHFCNCKDLWSIYHSDSVRLKAKIPQENLFDYQVGEGNKLFYGVELPLCPNCKKVYESVFLRLNVNPKLEFWNLLFTTKNIRNLEKIAIEDSLQISGLFVPMSINTGEKHFYLVRKPDGIDD